jgi:hypothetical protein
MDRHLAFHDLIGPIRLFLLPNYTGSRDRVAAEGAATGQS